MTARSEDGSYQDSSHAEEDSQLGKEEFIRPSGSNCSGDGQKAILNPEASQSCLDETCCGKSTKEKSGQSQYKTINDKRPSDIIAKRNNCCGTNATNCCGESYDSPSQVEFPPPKVKGKFFPSSYCSSQMHVRAINCTSTVVTMRHL